ncbi:MAG: PA14 domain-containing protein [Chloroflexota bacterium]
MTRFQEQSNHNSAAFRLAVAVILVLCILGFLVVLVGIGLYWNQGSLAQQPEPGATPPTIILEPASGSTNTPVTVHGQGWPQGRIVLIYTAAPDESSLPGFAMASATADDEGRFMVTFTLPAEPRWAEAGLVKIIARTWDGEATTQAFFKLADLPAELTETPPTPPAPTATATLVVQEPSPEPGQALATAMADVNIRSGPGTAYPVVGVLRAGQSAEITGIAPASGWWQIKFEGLADGRGWVAIQFVTAQNVTNIPIVQPPASPSPPPPPPSPTPEPPVITDWLGEYYDNPRLSGPPVLVRNDAAVLFGWGPDSPGPGLPADNFSARWRRDLHFSAGVYRFRVLVDDGARLWIDDQLIIDRWRTGPPESDSAEVALAEGTHRLRLEYFDYIYDAQVHLKWERVGGEEAIFFSDWQAEYFDNPDLEGVPVLVRNEAQIDHNWDTGSPGSLVPADNFSARWLRQVDLSDGVYVVRATVDDGVRVWVGDALVIDSWDDGEARTVESEGYVGAGRHWLRVEYYERGGAARIKVDWYQK